MNKNGTTWCDRSPSRPLQYYGLCTSQADFDKTLKSLKIKYGKKFVNDNANATTHQLTNNKGETVSIVCLDVTNNVTLGQVCGLLAHEAVHVWQEYCSDIGEHIPSSEFEAYTIQRITQALLYAYDDTLMSRKAKKKPSK